MEETLENIKAAIKLHIERMIANCKEVPADSVPLRVAIIDVL
jgi:predicted RNase H-like HicB family nuclease